MSGLAEILRTLGFEVSGSDLRDGENTKRLEHLGVTIHVGHRDKNVGGADVVVYSSAIDATNPEIVEAHRRGIPVITRAEMLAELMRVKHGVAIAGSHGKTTTTSLVATVLRAAALDPTVVVGGRMAALGSNARLGAGDLLVAEADESDGSFLRLTPTIAIVTNIDPEHLDHYGTFDNLKEAFVEFVEKVPFYGLAVLCLDHPTVQEILPRVRRRHVTYGLNPQADYYAKDLTYRGLETSFTVFKGKTELGEFTVGMPGAHNVLNALAVIAVADELEVPFDVMKELEDFKNLVYAFYGGMHRPRQLLLTWGSLALSCVLTSLNYRFTLFKPDGTPLRAIAACSFCESIPDAERVRKENPNSPDLTHLRDVREGDTLPLLANDIYGTPQLYLEVARANKLINFRRLRAASRLSFPPLDKGVKA